MIHIDANKEFLDWSSYDLSKDEIYIVDNLFPHWFINYVDNLIMSSYGWYYGHTSGYPTDGRDIGADPEWPEVGALKQSIFPPKSEIAKDSCFEMIAGAVLGTMNIDLELGEILINGQQYIHNTTPHRDCECDNGISFGYYVNKHWQPEWGGQLMAKLNDEWQGVDPAPGRIILFKGNIEHHGNPPNETYRGLRASLIYKFMRKNPLPARK